MAGDAESCPSCLQLRMEIAELLKAAASKERELAGTVDKLGRVQRLYERGTQYIEELHAQVRVLTAQVSDLEKSGARHEVTMATASVQTDPHTLFAAAGAGGSEEKELECGESQTSEKRLECGERTEGPTLDWLATADSVEEGEIVPSEQPSVADCVREAAEVAQSQTGYVYDASTGLYYDQTSGYYYDAEKGLHYEPYSGTYYSFDAEQGTYQFHSRVDLSQYSKEAYQRYYQNISGRKLPKTRSDKSEEKKTELKRKKEHRNKHRKKHKREKAESRDRHSKHRRHKYKNDGLSTREASQERASLEQASSGQASPEQGEVDSSESGEIVDRVCKSPVESPSVPEIVVQPKSHHKDSIHKSRHKSSTGRKSRRSHSHRESHRHMKLDSDTRNGNMESGRYGSSDPGGDETSDPDGERTSDPGDSASDDEVMEIWSDLESQNSDGVNPDINARNFPPCIRSMVTASDVLDIGSLYIITCNGATIGREPELHHTIHIPDQQVSKMHCEIRYNEELRRYEVQDQASQNGTHVNGHRLSEPKVVSGPYPLAHQDTLSLGGTTLELHIHAGTLTCDGCEPGVVSTRLGITSEQNQANSASAVDKEKMRRNQLKQIKKKYGLANSGYVDDETAINNPAYEDKADARRRTVGSDNPYQPDDAPASVHRAIPTENKGHRLLSKMGWKDGEGLGKSQPGITEPIQASVRARPSAGLGSQAAYQASLDRPDTRTAERWLKAQDRYNRLQDAPTPPTTARPMAFQQGQTETFQPPVGAQDDIVTMVPDTSVQSQSTDSKDSSVSTSESVPAEPKPPGKLAIAPISWQRKPPEDKKLVAMDARVTFAFAEDESSNDEQQQSSDN